MPLLTHPLRRAETVLRAVATHLDRPPSGEHAHGPQNRLQHVCAHNARATATAIDELERQAAELAGQAEGDLATAFHMLSAQPDCPTCQRLGREADAIHLDLGDQT